MKDLALGEESEKDCTGLACVVSDTDLGERCIAFFKDTGETGCDCAGSFLRGLVRGFDLRGSSKARRYCWSVALDSGLGSALTGAGELVRLLGRVLGSVLGVLGTDEATRKRVMQG